MKKCSTSGWDSAARKATGCPYVEWLKPGEEVETKAYDGPEPPEEDIPFPTEPNSQYNSYKLEEIKKFIKPNEKLFNFENLPVA